MVTTLTPSAHQLAQSRAEHWHQDGKALLSQEGLRDWLNRSGLVAYGPKVAQLGSPAPSLLEATMGKSMPTDVSLADTDAARTLLTRLIAEGSAVPLNLLGVAGAVGTDVPDFVSSAAVFSYIFTLRGNKAWKQPPVTSGPVKVSPLALATYEMLAAKVTMSAYDLATQLGKEVTEGAVLRALTELWSQLRVLPVTQLDGSATLWELASARFTKQIKAGANAGQPTALSALISLYLAQAVVASEDEIETFLSPLAPRSRVRGILHDLMGARQLETLVIDGKTMLHVTGELPAFVAPAPVAEAEGSEAGGSRISKFAAKPGSKIGTGLRSKPAFRSGFSGKPSFGAKPDQRERRPFERDEQGGADRPRAPRPAFGGGGARPDRPAFNRAGSDRPKFDKPRFDKPRFDKPWAEKPRVDAAAAPSLEGAGEARPPRREYTPRPEGAGPRKTFSKPGTFGRKREGFGGKPSFDRGAGGPPRRDFNSESRPPRREFSAEGRPPRRDFGDRPSSGGERPVGSGFKRTGGSSGSYAPRPRPSFGDRPAAGGSERPAFGGRPSFSRGPSSGDKPAYGAKPSFNRDRPERSGSDEAPRKVFRKFDAPRDKKPFGAKPFGAKPFGAKPFGAKPFGDRPPRSFDRPAADGGDRPRPAGPRFAGTGSDRPRPEGRPGFGARPAFGGKKPFGKPGGFAGAGGPFAKFADGKKPFRKPGPGGKKFDKPAGGGSQSGGGYRPTKRRAE